MQKELLTKNYATVGKEIGLELGTQMITTFKEAHPTEIAGWTIGRNILDEILAQPGCVAMRFYNAINEKGQKTLVYVGVDAAGEDIVKKVVVESDGSLATKAAIVADRGGPSTFDEIIKWFTGK
jgi:hypothetical protein